MATSKSYSEIGSSGLAEFSGQISEDFLRELRGKEGYKRYDEMRRNSPIIGALLLANEQSIRKVSWEFVSDEGETDPRLELLEAARENMSLSWSDHVSEVLTMLPFGFSLFEIVYERAEDGQILWRKFAPRGQDTIYQWRFDDEDGGLAGVTQMAAPQYKTTQIPIDKLLLYRTRVERNNPEGRSILRQAWIPYYYAKHLQQIEAITIERDGTGLPMITLPPNADITNSDTSDLGKASKIVRNVRNDEQAGIVLPSPDWKFELISSGGSKQIDVNAVINRYESRMLMSALAQFLMLGQEGVGSLALSTDQTDFFTMSVNSVADIISETFTKFAIPRLLKLNGYDADGIRLEHTPAGDTDGVQLADMLQKIGGYISWSAEDESWLRQATGMLERAPEDIQKDMDAKSAKAAEIAGAKTKAFEKSADDGDMMALARAINYAAERVTG